MTGVTTIDSKLEIQDSKKKIQRSLPVEEEGFLPLKTLQDIQKLEKKLQDYTYFTMFVSIKHIAKYLDINVSFFKIQIYNVEKFIKTP